MRHDAATPGKTRQWLNEATKAARMTRWVTTVSILAACGGTSPTLPTSDGTCVRTENDPSLPPVAKVVPHPVTLHGETRQDDYHWLREKNGNALSYLKQENAYADHVLKPTEALREKLFIEIKSRIKETDVDVPAFDRGFYYYSRTVEGAQYPLHCRKRGNLDATEEVLLDLNAMAVGQSFIGVGAFEVSDDGNLLAYSLDTTGFRAYTLHVKDLRDGRDLGVSIENTKSVAWASDNRTLFYVVDDAAKRPYRAYRHAMYPGLPLGDVAAELGTKDDVLVYEEPDERFNAEIARSRSGDLIFIGSYSHTTSEVSFLRASTPNAPLTKIKPRVDNHEYYVDHRGDTLFIRTNDTGRNFRLATAPLTAPGEWTELQATSDTVMLEALELFATHYVVQERDNGLPRLRVVKNSGASTTVPVDEPVYDLWGSDNLDFNATFYRYEYTSFTTPRSVIDVDVNTATRTVKKQIEVVGEFEPSEYVSERIYARASDGTELPISLVHKRGVPHDGSAPMWLTGYGAYGYPYPITFSHARLSLLNRGVIYAIAHVRGGSELGKRWHDQGRMQHKMNTFTDFIAAAEHLIAARYTTTPRLVIEGGSAGGLLMGAVTNMRPDLFGGVIADVPFVDVLNTMSDATLPLTVGEYEEWGNPSVAEQYAWIRAYCPYTNISRQAYPTMLVKTSWNDSQVMYWEPAKYVAKLRVHKTDQNPLLLFTNLGGGHGGASGRYDQWSEVAFDYAFALWRMGISD